jgi:hypothetical protein
VDANAVFAIHCAATFAMCGLIWFVQIVHYPLLSRFSHDGFAESAKAHCDRTGFIAGPLMLAEAGTLLLLLVGGMRGGLFLTSAALLAMIWLSTFLLQVPAHRVLLRGWDPGAHARLVATNWIRTVCWTLRSAALLAILAK